MNWRQNRKMIMLMTRLKDFATLYPLTLWATKLQFPINHFDMAMSNGSPNLNSVAPHTNGVFNDFRSPPLGALLLDATPPGYLI